MRRDSNLGQIVAIIARRDAFLGASRAGSAHGRLAAARHTRHAEVKAPGPQGHKATDAHVDVDLREAAPTVARPSRNTTPGRRRTASLLSSAAVVACIVAVVGITGNAGQVSPSARQPTAASVTPAASEAPSVVPANYSEVFGGRRCFTPATPRPSAGRVAITSPRNGERVGTPDTAGVLAEEAIKGTVTLAPGERLWLFFYATHPCLYYDLGSADVAAGRWEHSIVMAAKERGTFLLYAVVIGDEDSRRLEAALQVAARKGDTSPAIYRLPPRGQASYITLVCCK